MGLLDLLSSSDPHIIVIRARANLFFLVHLAKPFLGCAKIAPVAFCELLFNHVPKSVLRVVLSWPRFWKFLFVCESFL